jgi:diguanylate cyclase (GGDEF)-like protein
MRYAFAFAAIAPVWLLQRQLGLSVVISSPLILYLSAVMIAAWRGGLGAGLLATVLVSIARRQFLPEFGRESGLVTPPEAFGLVLFLAEGAMVSVLMGALHATCRRAEASARRAADGEARFRLLFERNMAGVARADLGGRLIESNPAFGRILSETAPLPVGCRSLSELCVAPTAWDTLVDQLHGCGALTSTEVCLRVDRDRTVWVLADLALFVEGPDGPTVQMTVIDLTDRKLLEHRLAEQLDVAESLNAELTAKQAELAQAVARLEELAVTDELTRLKNVRHFRESLQSAYALAVRQGLPLSLLMIDVDHFKRYNDAHGHPAGDDVLRTVGRILAGQVREHDLVARYGGEEFVLLLPATDAASSLLLAERLRGAIERHAWPHRPVTASFGAASLTTATLRSVDLIEEADKALYQSKREGRNRVSHYAPLAPAAVA